MGFGSIRSGRASPVSLRQNFRNWRAHYQRDLRGRYFLRLHMSLLLAGMTVVGVTATKWMLWAGIGSMPVRLPLAVFAAYLSFYGFVALWLRVVSGDRRLAAAPAALAAAAAMPPPPPPAQGAFHAHHLDALPDLVESTIDAATDGPSASSSSSGVGDAVGAVLDVGSDDFGFVLLLIAVALFVLSGIGAAAYLIGYAPEILAEIAFNGAFAALIGRTVTSQDGMGWAGVLARKTAILFGLMVLTSWGLGLAAQKYCPTAVTVQGALHCGRSAP